MPVPDIGLEVERLVDGVWVKDCVCQVRIMIPNGITDGYQTEQFVLIWGNAWFERNSKKDRFSSAHVWRNV